MSILKSFGRFEMNPFVKRFKSYKHGPLKTSVSRQTALMTIHPICEFDRGMEDICEFNKILYLHCWYIPQRENVISKSLPDKRFDRSSFKAELFCEIRHVDNRESDSHVGSHLVQFWPLSLSRNA